MTKIDELVEAARTIEGIASALKGKDGVTFAFDVLLGFNDDEMRDILLDNKRLWESLSRLITKLLNMGPDHAPAALSYLTGARYEKQMHEWVDDPEEAASIRKLFVSAIGTLQCVVEDLDELATPPAVRKEQLK